MSGFVLPAITLGLGAISVRAPRGFFPQEGSQDLTPDVVIEESHYDEMEITEHPVELGAAISDHAFKRPAEVVIHCAWSNSPPGATGLGATAVGAAAALGGSFVRTALGATRTIGSLLTGDGAEQAKQIYESFQALQSARGLIDVYTGKRVYRNMLVRTLAVTTDAKSENALVVAVTCREVLFASTSVVDLTLAPTDTQRFGQTKDFGQVQTFAVPAPVVATLPIQ